MYPKLSSDVIQYRAFPANKGIHANGESLRVVAEIFCLEVLRHVRTSLQEVELEMGMPPELYLARVESVRKDGAKVG